MNLFEQLPKQFSDRVVAGSKFREMPSPGLLGERRDRALLQDSKHPVLVAEPLSLREEPTLCLLEDGPRLVRQVEDCGYVQDPDVLDTWFSSALWPFSTLGWPVEPDEDEKYLKQYYPGSVLCTSRDIITNWVARMVMFGLYAMGEVPFDHVYIHPKILDGRGETMSKSKGNGVDPVDIIDTHGADALRYSMADMTTETQDIRMPVEYLCPHCDKLTEQQAALKVEEQRRKSRGEKLDRKLQPSDCQRVKCVHKECGREFATQWADESTKKELGLGRESSEKFDIGRNFCNKLWNAARFAFMNLSPDPSRDREGAGRLADTESRASACVTDRSPTEPQASACATDRSPSESRTSLRTDDHTALVPFKTLSIPALPPEDRWILARLSQTIRRYHECIRNYQFSSSVKELREFFWDCLCDWYIELTKPRLAEPQASACATDRISDPSRDHKGADVKPHESATDPARQILAFCMDQVLRLWHPTIPFITERLWQQLNEIAPRRDLPGIVELNTNTLLIKADFPPVEGYPAFDDYRMIRAFADLQDATRGVRDVRASSGVSPKDRVTVTLIAPAGHLDAVRANAHILRHMAGIGELDVLSDGKRPKNAGSVTIGHLRIYVHNITDDAVERKRTEKQLEQVDKQIAGKEAKLNNEKFTTNADPDVVEAERRRLHELLAERASLQTHLKELSE